MPSTWYFHMPKGHIKKQPSCRAITQTNGRRLMPGASSSETQQSPMPLSSCLLYSKKGCHTVHPAKAKWDQVVQQLGSIQSGKSMGIRSTAYALFHPMLEPGFCC